MSGNFATSSSCFAASLFVRAVWESPEKTMTRRKGGLVRLVWEITRQATLKTLHPTPEQRGAGQPRGRESGIHGEKMKETLVSIKESLQVHKLQKAPGNQKLYLLYLFVPPSLPSCYSKPAKVLAFNDPAPKDISGQKVPLRPVHGTHTGVIE